MRPSLYSLLAFLALAVSVTGSPQDEWIFPTLPNYSSSANDGVQYTFRWSADLQTYFKEFCPKCDTENVALWLTGGGGPTFIKHLVSSSVDVANSRSYSWKVNASGPAVIEQWVLRFTTPGGYNYGQNEVSSPMFKIIRSSSKSTTTSTQSKSTTTSPGTRSSPTSTFAIETSISASTISSTAPEATLTASSPSDSPDVFTEDTKKVVSDVKSKLKTPEIAGIAAGVAGVLLTTIVFLAVCCYRRRKRRNRAPYPVYLQPVSNTQISHPAYPAAVHAPSTNPESIKPHPAYPAAVRAPSTRPEFIEPHGTTPMSSRSRMVSHAGVEDSRMFYQHPGGSHDTARADRSDEWLISPPTRAPQDKRSLQERTTGHADTEHGTGSHRRDQSKEVPEETMPTENENPKSPKVGRFSAQMREYLR